MANFTPDIDLLFRRIIENDDQKAFEALFHIYYSSLCNFSFRFLGDQNLAEEAVSETFVKLWVKRGEIAINKSFQAYLYTSVRNQSIDLLRKYGNNKRNFVQYDLDIQTQNYSPEEEMQFQQLSENIEKGIEELPKQCKKIFLMSRDNQYSYQEIADKLGISLKTVKTQMYRAVKKLRIYMKNRGVEILLFFL